MAIDRDMRIRILLDAMDKASGPIKAIRAESRKAGSEMRDTRAELVKLQKAQADLKQFRDLKRGLKTTAAELEAAKRKASSLAAQLEATDKPTKKLTSDFARAKREAADLGRAFDTQRRSLQETRDRLAAAGVSTRNLVADERKLANQVASTNDKLRAQEDRFRNLNANAPRRIAEAGIASRVDADIARERERIRDRRRGDIDTAGGIVGGAVAAATTATGVDAVKRAATFETQLTTIGQKAGRTREQVEALGIAFDRIGPKYGIQPSQMAEGFDMLVSNGMDYVDAQRSVLTLSKAAFAYQTEQRDLANAAFAVNSNLNVPVKRTSRAVELMAAGDAEGAVGVPDMARGLPALTAQMKALGRDGLPALADIIATLEIAKRGAATPDEAVTNVGNLYDKIYAPQTAGAFKKMNIDLVKEMKKRTAKGMFPTEAIVDITSKALKGDINKLGYLFQDAQVQKALRPLLAAPKDYTSLRDRVLNNKVAIDEKHAERAKDTASKAAFVQANWEASQHTTGRRARPATNWLLDAVNKMLVDGQRTDEEILAKLRAGDQARLHPRKSAIAVEIEQARGRDAAFARAYETQFAQQRAANQRMLAEADRWRAQMKARYGNRTDFVAIGANMMLGIEQGVNSRMAALRTRVLDVVAQMKAWFKAKLQIRSPSRVFAGYGGHVVDGLAQGIDRGAKAPVQSIRRVAGRVAAAGMVVAAGTGTSPAIAAQRSASPPPARASISNHYEIHLHAAPGMDEAALMRMFDDRFAEIKRQERAQSESSLRDDE